MDLTFRTVIRIQEKRKSILLGMLDLFVYGVFCLLESEVLKHVFLLHQELDVAFGFMYYKNIFLLCFYFLFLLECPIH